MLRASTADTWHALTTAACSSLFTAHDRFVPPLLPHLTHMQVFVVVTACWIAPVGGLDGHPAARWQRSRQQAQPQGTKRN